MLTDNYCGIIIDVWCKFDLAKDNTVASCVDLLGAIISQEKLNDI